MFNIFCCFGMFVNKHFTYLGRAHLKESKRCYNVIPHGTLFLCKDEHVSRFSDLHQCTFNTNSVEPGGMLISNTKISCKPEFLLLKQDEMCKVKSELQIYSARKSVFFEKIVIFKTEQCKVLAGNKVSLPLLTKEIQGFIHFYCFIVAATFPL